MAQKKDRETKRKRTQSFSGLDALMRTRDISMHLVYNMNQQSDSASLRDFYSNSKTASERIYKNYAEMYERDFLDTFDMTPDEFLQESAIIKSIQKELFEDSFKGLAQEWNQLKAQGTKFSRYAQKIATEDTGMVKQDKVPQAIKALEEFTQSLEAFLEVVGRVPDFDGEIDNSYNKGDFQRYASKNLMYSMDKSSVTALENVNRLVDQLNQTIRKYSSLKPEELTDISLNLTRSEYKSNLTGESRKSHNYKFTTLPAQIRAGLNNIIGFAMEATIAKGIQDALASNMAILKSTLLSGASGEQYIKLRNGDNFKYNQAKVDVSAPVKVKGQTIKVGFSAKNQSTQPITGVSSSTSLNTTTLDQVLTALSASPSATSAGQTTSALAFYLNYKKDTLKSADSDFAKLRMFIAAVAADYTVAMGAHDRVHFVVFQDKIVSLSEYYNQLSAGYGLDLRYSDMSNSEEKSLLRKLDEGQMSIYQKVASLGKASFRKR